MRPLIIERPDLQTMAQRASSVGITTICWLVWLYLFVPLASLAAWSFGVVVAYDMLFDEATRGTAAERALTYGKGIAIMTGAFFTWAVYNYLRWQGVERRQPPRQVTTEELADTFRVPVERITDLRSQPVATLSSEELAQMLGDEVDLERRLQHNDATDLAPEEGRIQAA